MKANFELSLQTSILICSSAHCRLFFELPQCFTFWIILYFHAILRVFVLYSQDGDNISSDFPETLHIELTFPEFHFETVAKVDFPSACI